MEWMSKPRAGSGATSIVTEQDVITPRWGFAVTSGILGWILDAFDFFVLVFLVDVLANNFHVSKAEIVWTITITLATRPIGAFVLGSLADRYGRRRPLIAAVLYFSIITALTPFAPSYAVFATLRALYGIGMGGYWGIGASLVMESSPTRWRGPLLRNHAVRIFGRLLVSRCGSANDRASLRMEMDVFVRACLRDFNCIPDVAIA